MKLPREHADVVLELVYLIAVADGRLDEQELDAFRDVVASARGVPSIPQGELDEVLDLFAANVEHKDITERVRELSPKLPQDLREVAFKMAVRLSLVDLDASREEEKVKNAMIEALGLTAERADALTAEVYDSLDVGGDE